MLGFQAGIPDGKWQFSGDSPGQALHFIDATTGGRIGNKKLIPMYSKKS